VFSIFLAAVPVLVSTNVPVLPSYLGEHVEAECNAYEVPPMEKDFYILQYGLITNDTALP
jgi:hypothetical protein